MSRSTAAAVPGTWYAYTWQYASLAPVHITRIRHKVPGTGYQVCTGMMLYECCGRGNGRISANTRGPVHEKRRSFGSFLSFFPLGHRDSGENNDNVNSVISRLRAVPAPSSTGKVVLHPCCTYDSLLRNLDTSLYHPATSSGGCCSLYIYLVYFL